MTTKNLWSNVLLAMTLSVGLPLLPMPSALAHTQGNVSAVPMSSDWSAYEYLGNGVSVSYCQVNNTTWTWKFRNDGDTTITYMSFEYVDTRGSHSDVIPSNISPGGSSGGWSVYTAYSKPDIRIKSVSR
jgi:hypothetical protein